MTRVDLRADEAIQDTSLPSFTFVSTTLMVWVKSLNPKLDNVCGKTDCAAATRFIRRDDRRLGMGRTVLPFSQVLAERQQQFSPFQVKSMLNEILRFSVGGCREPKESPRPS